MDLTGVAEQQVILQFVNNVFFDAQGIHHHVVAAMELNEVEAAEGGRVLVLVTAVNLKVQPLNLVGQVRHGVGIHHGTFPAGHGGQHGHHHRGGGSKARSGRRVALKVNLAALLDVHCLEGRRHQIQLAVVHIVLVGIVLHRHVEIQGVDHDLVVVSGNNGTVSVLVDGASDNCSALLLAERSHIRTSAAKAYAQRRSSSDNHNFLLQNE